MEATLSPAETPSEKQMALFAVTHFSCPILACEGSSVESDVETIGTDMADFLGVQGVPKHKGFYIWEGKLVVINAVGYMEAPDPDVEWRGKWRKATIEDLSKFGFLTSDLC